MQRLTTVSITCLALALSACGSEAEETPDITEAIPLDADQEGEASAAGEGSALADGVELSGGAISGDTPALPGANGESSGNASGGSERTLPDTMEAGSNPPDFEPPKGSKVQRIN